MFRKSSYCKTDSDLCVEVSMPDSAGQMVLIRESKNGGSGGNFLVFTLDEWAAFIAGAKAGEFDA